MANEKLEALARFVVPLENKTFQAGEWRGGEKAKSGAIEMPWFDWSEDMEAFVNACSPLSIDGFNWVEWKGTPEGEKTIREIEDASEEDLRKLITLLVRQERFVEGLLAGACEDGTLLRICKRAKALIETAP